MASRGMIQVAAWIGGIGLLLVTGSCGDSNDPGDGGGDLVTQQIGPDGGTVRTPDARLSLVFPAGALAETQTITINEIPLNQLGAEFNELQAERAYELGPAGLAFQLPVSVVASTTQQPVQDDGSLQVQLQLLLTSAGGIPEMLSNTMASMEGDRVSSTGQLTHFSPLVVTKHYVTLTVQGVPAELPVEGSFTANLNLSLEPPHTGANVAAVDLSIEPVEPQFASPGQLTTPLFGGGDVLQGSFPYKCIAAGEGQFAVQVSGELRGNPRLPPGDFFVEASTPVKCVDEPPSLAVTKSGTGTGTVTTDGINCGSDCAEQYPDTVVVDVTAQPDEGSSFVTWSGDCTGTDPVFQDLLVDGPKTCNAQFDRGPAAPVIEPAGSVNLDDELEALALDPSDPNRLFTVGFNLGILDIWDITDPASPQRVAGSGQQFCIGATDATVSAPGVFMQPNIFATALLEFNGCLNTIPPTQPTVLGYDYAPGQVRFIPGTMDVLIPAFSHSFVERRSMTGQPIRISLGSTKRCPFGLAISGNTALVVNEKGIPGSILEDCQPGVSVIDLTTNQSMGSLNLGSDIRRGVISPDGQRAWVSDFQEDRIYVISLSTRSLISSFPTGDGPVGLALTPDGEHLLVVTWNERALSLVDPDTGEEVASVEITGQNPGDLQVTSDGRRAVVEIFGNLEDEEVGGGFETFNLNF